MENKFWKWSNGVESTDSKLILEGTISSEDWWGDGLDVTPQAFREELAKHSGELIVSINSTGGDVFAGVAIYNALVEYSGNVTVEVNGLAASIASVISMAGDKIVMLPGSSMMIHKPWTLGIGNADELEKVVKTLNSIESSLIPIYTARTGQSEERIKEMLADETWLNPQEAVELGFADELVEAKKKVGFSDSIKNALNGQFAFSMSATKEAMAKVVERLKAEEVEETDVTDATETADETPNGESEVETADVEAETETETTEVEAETTKVETNNSAEETKEMEKEELQTQEAQAQAQVLEPKAQATTEAPKATVTFENYIQSPKAVEDFAQVLAANPGEANEESVARVKAAWKEVTITNGLAGGSADYFVLPAPLVTKIEDAVKASGIYNALNHTGLDVARVDWDKTDAETDTSRAGGHKKGVNKEEQILDFDNRVIRAQYIYKYLTLNKEDVRQQRSTGALTNFVMTELPTRVIREIERAVVIGDGRSNGSNRKIREDAAQGGFTPILNDAIAGNAFATVYTPGVGETKSVALVKAIDEIEVEGDVYLIAKKGYLTDVRLEFIANGTSPIPPSKATTSEALGLAGIFEPKWFNDTTSPDFDAILVVLSAYKTVGDAGIESFTNFILKENKHEYLSEIYKGGALASAGVAAVAIGEDESS